MIMESGRKTLKWSKLIFLLVILALLLLFLRSISQILIPFVFAVLLSYILEPLVDYFERRGIKREIALIVLFAAVVAALFFAGRYFVPGIVAEVKFLKEKMPQYIATINNNIKELQNSIGMNVEGSSQSDQASDKLHPFIGGIMEKGMSQVSNFFSILSLLILIPVITFFILKDGRRARKSLVTLVPNRYFELVMTLLYEIDNNLGRYIRGQLLDASIVGFLSIIGLWLLGVKYCIIIGIIAGISNMIPYLGPIVGLIPAVLSASLGHNGFSLMPAIAVTVLFAGIQALDNIIISPTVVGKSVDLHPMAVIFVILVGAELMGFMGMLIAVPFTCILKVTFQILYRRLKDYAVV